MSTVATKADRNSRRTVRKRPSFRSCYDNMMSSPICQKLEFNSHLATGISLSSIPSKPFLNPYYSPGVLLKLISKKPFFNSYYGVGL